MMRASLAVLVWLSILCAARGVSGDQVQAPDPTATPQQSSEFQPVILMQFAVSDLDRSIAFYRDVVGLEFQLRIEELRWARFRTAVPGVILGLGESDTVSGSGTTSVNLGVHDADATRGRLEAAGVTFLGPTTDIPGVVRLADFLDPDGNKIRLAGPSKGP